MKRRTFIKAVFGAVAAVYAPLSLVRDAVAVKPPFADGTPYSSEGQSYREIQADLLEEAFWGTGRSDVPYGIDFYVKRSAV